MIRITENGRTDFPVRPFSVMRTLYLDFVVVFSATGRYSLTIRKEIERVFTHANRAAPQEKESIDAPYKRRGCISALRGIAGDLDRMPFVVIAGIAPPHRSKDLCLG
jgi:hypothetical protein